MVQEGDVWLAGGETRIAIEREKLMAGGEAER